MEDDIKHGTSSGYKLCRKRPEKACRQCKDYNKKTSAERMAKARERLATNPEEFKHGTYYVYKLGCECDLCLIVGHERNKAYVEKRESKNLDDIPDDLHGTLAGYNDYRCRCSDCRLVRFFYRILIKSQGIFEMAEFVDVVMVGGPLDEAVFPVKLDDDGNPPKYLRAVTDAGYSADQSPLLVLYALAPDSDTDIPCIYHYLTGQTFP